MAAKEICMSFGKQGRHLHSSFSISVLSFIRGSERNRVPFFINRSAHLGIKDIYISISRYLQVSADGYFPGKEYQERSSASVEASFRKWHHLIVKQNRSQ